MRAGDVVTTDFGYDAWKAWIALPEPCPNATCDYGSRDAHFMNDWRRCVITAEMRAEVERLRSFVEQLARDFGPGASYQSGWRRDGADLGTAAMEVLNDF